VRGYHHTQNRSSRCLQDAYIKTEIIPSSSQFGKEELRGQERIRYICEKNSATDYINVAGGRELYETAFFVEKNIRLFFLRPEIPSYKQFSRPFVPGLSIIDVLMFNPRPRVAEMVRTGTLEPA
jgi:hypothetical protein